MGLHDTYDLLQQALAGHAEARGQLLEQVRPRLVMWVTGQLSAALRGQVEPEDVAQEILLALHKDLDGFKGPDKRAFHGWLFTIARNRIRDLADRARALKRRLPPPKSFDAASPSGAESRREDVATMMAALSELEEPHRGVIMLLRIEERSTEELAQLWNVSENAVRIRYCRALKALRTKLKIKKQPATRP